jgi:hypothetical protein
MQCEGVGEGWVRAPLPATPPHTERLAIESQSLRTRTISVGRDEDEIAPPPPSLKIGVFLVPAVHSLTSTRGGLGAGGDLAAVL